MLPLYFSSVLFYLLATLSIFADLRKLLREGDAGRAGVQWATLAPWAVALVLHAMIVAQFNTDAGFNFAFFKALCILGGLLAGLLLLGSYFQRLASLGLFVLPVSAASVVLVAFDSGERIISDTLPIGLRIHIFTAFLSYGTLLLAGLEALVIIARKRQLARHRASLILDALPSLEALEAFLIHLLLAGIALLSLSLVSGYLSHEDLLAQHLAHKTFFSVLAWLVFAVILWNRMRGGWHGGKIVTWTLWGSGLLVIAYFGSKFVLEFLLRT